MSDFNHAKHTLEHIKKYHPELSGVKLAVAAIESDICDRGGLKHEWRKIEDHIIDEIKAVWEEIIADAMKGNSTNPLRAREQKLLEVIRQQAEALKFYGDPNSWDTFEVFDIADIIDHNDRSLVLRYGNNSSVGGKRARATTAKVTETLKGIGVEL